MGPNPEIILGDITDTPFDVNTASGRLLHALEALEWWEDAEGYEVDMQSYGHWAGGGEPCFACFGGIGYACMRGYVSTSKTVTNYERSLDWIREGDVQAYLRFFDYDDDDEDGAYDQLVEVPSYNEHPKRFKKALKRIAIDLANQGR